MATSKFQGHLEYASINLNEKHVLINSDFIILHVTDLTNIKNHAFFTYAEILKYFIFIHHPRGQ